MKDDAPGTDSVEAVKRVLSCGCVTEYKEEKGYIDEAMTWCDEHREKIWRRLYHSLLIKG